MNARIGAPSALLAAIALGLAACGGGSGAATSPPASRPPAATQAPASASAAACADSSGPGTVEVAIANSAFDPATATAKVGDVVSWTNSDGIPHSAVITGTDCATDDLTQGQSGAIVFNAAGSYPYICGVHPTMKGTIEVE